MGIYERNYTQHGNSFYSGGGGGQGRPTMPSISPVVKWLLIANVAIFLVEAFLFAGTKQLTIIDKLFAVYPSGLQLIQVWRYITYQFLHADMFHLFFNMLGLFFLGPTLERHWGSKRFLYFYLGCGIAGGICYPALALTGMLQANLPLVGASGAILGMLAACAILFPRFVVFFYFFPVPIRIAAVILTLLYVVNVFTGGINAGGDAAHLGGMAAGAVYVMLERGMLKQMISKQQTKMNQRRQDQHHQNSRHLQAEVDRILEKVHQQGIQSLSKKERRILQQATEAEQTRNRS